MKHIFSKKNRSLLAELVRTDFKLRYQGSVLGYTWSLLRPLFMFVILYLVFAVILKVGKGVPNFPIYLLLGIVLWNFFVETTQQSLTSIVLRGDLIRKIYIPRWLIIISTSFGALINLSLNLLVVMALALISRMDLLLTSIFLPIFIVEIYIFAVGLSLFLSTLYVKYRDINYVWEIALLAGFYATPILYPLTLITNVKVQKLIMLNPMAQSIQGARYAFVTHQSVTIGQTWQNNAIVIIPLIIILLIVLTGVLYFRKESKYFAENL